MVILHCKLLATLVFAWCWMVAKQQITTDDCGKTVGCFVLPKGCTTACNTVHKYIYDEKTGILNFELHTNKKWSALAFNTVATMGGLKGVMCLNKNNGVEVVSIKASGLDTPDILKSGTKPDITGHQIVSTGVDNGITTCKINRTLNATTGSKAYVYDLTVHKYVVFAHGMFKSGGAPNYHGYGPTDRMKTTSPVDMAHYKVIYPCDAKPCQNNGSCHRNKTTYTCSCRNGYRGDNCQISPCDVKRCLNNGRCALDERSTDGSNCSCVNGFTGDLCQESPCISVPCKNNGSCFVNNTMSTGYACSCRNGWKGNVCHISPCDVKRCLNKGMCVLDERSTNGSNCSCVNGFTGDLCQVPMPETLILRTILQPRKLLGLSPSTTGLQFWYKTTALVLRSTILQTLSASPSTTRLQTLSPSTARLSKVFISTTGLPNLLPSTTLEIQTSVNVLASENILVLHSTLKSPSLNIKPSTSTIAFTKSSDIPTTTLPQASSPETSSSQTTNETPFNPKEFCRKQSMGFYPHPKDHEKMLVCFNGYAAVRKCYEAWLWRRLLDGHCGTPSS